MKTLLLLLAALALSAQTVDKFSPAVPRNYFTGTALNGAWWKNATRMERWVYLQAVSETLGRQVWIPDDAYRARKLTVPVVDVIAARNPTDEPTQLQLALDCLVPHLRGEPVSSR
jgi:hypothetical protein